MYPVVPHKRLLKIHKDAQITVLEVRDNVERAITGCEEFLFFLAHLTNKFLQIFVVVVFIVALPDCYFNYIFLQRETVD